ASEVLGASDGPAPPAADEVAEVDALQRRLAGAVARVNATFAEADLAAIEALTDEARAQGYRPLVGEAVGEAAVGHLNLGHTDRAEALLLEALTIAEATGDTRRLAALWPHWMLLLVQ